MMKLRYVMIIAITLMVILAGCSNIDGKQPSSIGDIIQTKDASSNPEGKLKIYHFHGTHQCYTCKTVGAYAEETVNAYFADELKSGKIVFGHINFDVAENSGLATKYGVTGPSLWIGSYNKEGFHKEVNNDVWYKISNKQDYMDYLKGIIEQKLEEN